MPYRTARPTPHFSLCEQKLPGPAQIVGQAQALRGILNQNTISSRSSEFGWPTPWENPVEIAIESKGFATGLANPVRRASEEVVRDPLALGGGAVLGGRGLEDLRAMWAPTHVIRPQEIVRIANSCREYLGGPDTVSGRPNPKDGGRP
jgi:hypothetical protein